ncbi:MAG TPA: NAD(P)H-binding protein [Kiritimatiellia bacterium]|nr:NAD(P)H-binding protein [Kiritimatiellia bacterium]
MKILVIGGTRGIGSQVMHQGAGEGHEMTSLSRLHSSRLPEGSRHVVGDVRQLETIKEAVAGQDAVVWAVGAPITRSRVTLFSEGTKMLLVAMGELGVSRLVAVTGIGAGDTKGHGGFSYDHIINPLFLRTIYEDKDRQEEIIRASTGVRWTIVRPGFLTNGPKVGVYDVVVDLEGVVCGKIARADVADFILEELRTSRYVGQAPLVMY